MVDELMDRIRIRTHPGQILNDEFLVPLKMSARELAEAIGVSPRRISAIISGRRSLTADTAIRLGRYFGTTSELWTGLQQGHDLSVAAAKNVDAYSLILPRAAGTTVAPRREVEPFWRPNRNKRFQQ